MKSALSIVALIVAICGAIAVALYPQIVHWLDRGEATVPVEALGPGFAPESRNLLIRGGHLDTAHLINWSRVDEQGRTKWRKSVLPLVDGNWTPEREVRALYATPTWPGGGIEEVLRRTELRGLLRNVAWESPPSDVLESLRGAGLHLADGVVFVEERP